VQLLQPSTRSIQAEDARAASSGSAAQPVQLQQLQPEISAGDASHRCSTANALVVASACVATLAAQPTDNAWSRIKSIPDILKERAAASSPTEVIAVQAEGTHTNSAPQGTGAASSGSAAQPAQLQRCQEEGQRNNEKRAQTTTSRMCTEKQVKTCWNEVRSERVDRANKEKESIMAFDKHKEGDSDWCIHLEIEKQVQESLIDVTSDEQENQQSSCAAASQGTSAACSGNATQPAQLQ
jgi:hypothetical protein